MTFGLPAKSWCSVGLLWVETSGADEIEIDGTITNGTKTGEGEKTCDFLSNIDGRDTKYCIVVTSPVTGQKAGIYGQSSKIGDGVRLRASYTITDYKNNSIVLSTSYR